ncbi:MAG: DpnI domain-containing protein [Candidatus Acidiferrales bacterium]
METALPTENLERYHSASQRARVATEAWATANLYCVNCDSPRLEPTPPNAEAVDYHCPRCRDPFQLKGQSKPFGHRILDSAYSKMMAAIASDRAPHFVLLHYVADRWRVSDVLLIPRFAIPKSAIEKRKPLSASARRAGWVGCNIVLTNIPDDARVRILTDGVPEKPSEARRRFRHVRPLAELSVEERGWTLDVLTAVRSLNRGQFVLDDIYGKESELSRLHPDNRHVRDKIRQQLQVLRDKGLLQFLGRGEYRLS